MFCKCQCQKGVILVQRSVICRYYLISTLLNIYIYIKQYVYNNIYSKTIALFRNTNEHDRTGKFGFFPSIFKKKTVWRNAESFRPILIIMIGPYLQWVYFILLFCSTIPILIAFSVSRKTRTLNELFEISLGCESKEKVNI